MRAEPLNHLGPGMDRVQRLAEAISASLIVSRSSTRYSRRHSGVVGRPDCMEFT